MAGSPGDVGEATPEWLENELHIGKASEGATESWRMRLCPFSNPYGVASPTVSLLYDLAGGSACMRGQHLLPANRVYSSKLKSH